MSLQRTFPDAALFYRRTFLLGPKTSKIRGEVGYPRNAARLREHATRKVSQNGGPAKNMNLDWRICSRARLSRDPRFDGKFFIGVVGSMVYCRPICPAPTPKEKNCRYFPSAAAAEAGFRPCLRCCPESSPGTPAWLGTSNTVAGSPFDRRERTGRRRSRSFSPTTGSWFTPSSSPVLETFGGDPDRGCANSPIALRQEVD